MNNIIRTFTELSKFLTMGLERPLSSIHNKPPLVARYLCRILLKFGCGSKKALQAIYMVMKYDLFGGLL